MGATERLLIQLNKVINIKMGIAGAVLMFTAVFLINIDFGWLPALIAGLKQAAYTLLIGGLIIKLCENISLKFRSASLSVTLACIVPSGLAILVVYLVHSMKGTPLPFESTIPTAVMSVPGFLFIGMRKRRTSFDQPYSS